MAEEGLRTALAPGNFDQATIRQAAILKRVLGTPTKENRRINGLQLSAMSLPNGIKLKIGECEVNSATDEISRNGTVFKVEPRAIRVLVYLAERQGQVISVEELLDNVWANLVVTPDSVYTAIAVLRRALGDDNKESRYIVNVPRRGYRLLAEVTHASGSAVDLKKDPPPPKPATTPAAQLPVERSGRLKTLGVCAAAILFVGLVYLAAERPWVAKSVATPVDAVPTLPSVISDKSIAVLPFLDMSEKHDQEYFSDGMAEEVLDLLAKVPDLQVIGRTSSFQFKGQRADLRTIGSKLNVNFVVEGSVRKTDNRVRVTAQLVDTRTGTHRWSDTYDRDVSDVLKVQVEIATSLVRALQLEFQSSLLEESRPPLRNEQAYDMYLRGLHAMDRRDQSGLEEAVADFRRSLDLDPSFAASADMLARTQINLAYWGFVPARSGFEQARSSAKSALLLNSKSLYAHGVLCGVYTEYDWNWNAAERESKIIVALAPKNPAVLLYAADERMATGHLSEALQLINAAIAADPFDPELHVERSWIYERMGRLAEAEVDGRRVLEISPTFAWAHYYLGIVLLIEGKADAALVEMQNERTSSGLQQAGLALANHALHRAKASDGALARLKADNAMDLAMAIAETYAFRGEKDSAFEWLDRAFAQKDINLYYIKADPLLKYIEPDPRYKAFLQKMGLPL